MSVWNRPMFKGSFPPGSARGALQRMRMQEGGSPWIEQLSGEDRGVVLPEAMDRRERDLQETRADLAAQAGPPIPRDQMQQAGWMLPFMIGSTLAGIGTAGWNYFGGEDEPFQPTLPPAGQRVGEDRSDQLGGINTDISGSLRETQERIEAEQAAAAAAAEGDTPAVGPYGSRPTPPLTEEPTAAAEETGVGVADLMGLYSFSPEERAERLRAAYEGREAVYDEILGDPERRRNNAKAQLLFSIAQRALQFAGGVTAEGRPMTGSMVSQAAQAFAPVFGDVAEYNAAMEQQDQEMRAARLAAAEKDVVRDEESRASLLSALAKARGESELTASDVLRPATEELADMTIAEPPDLTPAYSFGATMFNTFGKAARIVNWDAAPETTEAVRWANQFNTTILADLARSIQQGRTSNFTLQLVQSLLPTPGGTFESVASAIDTYAGLKDQLDRDVRLLAREYESYRALNLAPKAVQTLSLLRRANEASMQLAAILSGLRGEVSEEEAAILGNVTDGPAPDVVEE